MNIRQRSLSIRIAAPALAAALLGVSAWAFAQESSGGNGLSVDEIVRKAYFVAYYQGKDGKARAKMTIVDEQKRTRNRELTILRWDQPMPEEKKDDKDVAKKDEFFAGEQKYYVYFHEPPDIEKTSFLVHKHLDRDDDRWLYQPNLDLVKRIAGSEKRTSFVGSNFFYEDISGRRLEDDNHELLETTNTYYVLKNTPKDPKSVEFAYYKMWIHRKTFLVVKTVYYDEKDEAYRQYEVKAVGQPDQYQGYWTVTKSRMTDLRTGRYTDLEYSSVKYDIGVPEDIFQERYLRRPPMKYIQD